MPVSLSRSMLVWWRVVAMRSDVARRRAVSLTPSLGGVQAQAFATEAGAQHVILGNYLCCAHCVDKFKADPQKFVGKPGA